MCGLNKLKDRFTTILETDSILENEPMSAHTSFKIGGPVNILLMPKTKLEAVSCAAVCRQENIPFYIMGNGSNLLVKDGGFSGVIIKLSQNLSSVTLSDDNTIKCESGLLLSALANTAANAGLKGFEFAAGIPGTVGGAISMNAGAYDGEIKDVILSAEVITKEGKLIILSKDELELSYRSSAVEKNGYIVLGAVFKGEPGSIDEIKAKMAEYNKLRKEKQPVDMPSAGSTFKRPHGYFAGKLIMDSGLKGYTIGGAVVSEKHCGFVVNKGGASAKDVISLIEHVQEVVKEKFNIILEPEIKIIGND